jgi:hypothetical protein
MKYQAGGAEWLYPHDGDPLPESGAKVLLLTKGGIATVGVWNKDFTIGWLPLPKRNQTREERGHYEP